MILIKRLLQYNIFSLVRIAFYKALKKIVVLAEKHCCHKEYCREVAEIVLSDSQIEKINLFWEESSLHIVSCEDHQELLNGMVTNFNRTYPLDSYLKDPVSQKHWPSDKFFSETQTKINGYGDVKYVLELNKLNHLVEAAKSYHLYGENQYIKYITDQIFKWKNEVPYERSVANRIIMDIAFRSINLIFISLLCMKNDVFQKQAYPTIHNILKLSERQMRIFSTPKWFKTGNGANHVIGEMVGLIIVQRWLSFVENKKSWLKPIEQEYQWLYETLNKLIAPSGVYLENSANYTRVVGEFLVCLQLFENFFLFRNRSLDVHYLQPLLEYLNDLQCNGLLPNFGDNDAATCLIPFKRDFTDIRPLLIYFKNHYFDGQINLHKYEKDGQLIWNSEDENRFHLFMRFGLWSIFKQGSATHNHADLLSVILFANGNPFIIDKGCLFYNQSEEIKLQALSVESHNTIFIKGYEQAHYNSGWFEYPKSEYHTDVKYPQIIDAQITTIDGISHKRSLFYKQGELKIADNVKSPFDNKPIIMQYLLHESVKPQKINHSSVSLKLASGICLLVSFEGIKDLMICEDFYFPHYGVKRNTHSIRCSVTSNQVSTYIKPFNPNN